MLFQLYLPNQVDTYPFKHPATSKWHFHAFVKSIVNSHKSFAWALCLTGGGAVTKCALPLSELSRGRYQHRCHHYQPVCYISSFAYNHKIIRRSFINLYNVQSIGGSLIYLFVPCFVNTRYFIVLTPICRCRKPCK